MTSRSFAHVIQLSDKRRFIVLREEYDLLLFVHYCTVEENNNSSQDTEYWKCIHRTCSATIRTRGLFFDSTPDSPKHNHNSKSSKAFLKKNPYVIEKFIRPNKILASNFYAPISIVNEPSTKVDINASSGTVLKQLLLSGVVSKEEERKEDTPTKTKYRTGSSFVHSSSLGCLQQTGIMKPKPRATSDVQILTCVPVNKENLYFHPSHAARLWMSEIRTERWSPPVLKPPPPGRSYSPPLTPVAHIKPYVEPQVMYNPFFLWQLYSYKQSCCGNFPFSLPLQQAISP